MVRVVQACLPAQARAGGRHEWEPTRARPQKLTVDNDSRVWPSLVSSPLAARPTVCLGAQGREAARSTAG